MKKAEFHRRVQRLRVMFNPETQPAAFERAIYELWAEQRHDKAKDKNSRPPSNHSRRRGKYMPHQGRRECARRVYGGFARIKDWPAAALS